MFKDKIFYVISMGIFDSNKVYLDNPKLYKTIPTTTKNILYARFFDTEEEATFYAKRHFAANVEGFKIVPLENNDEYNSEVVMLKASNLQLQEEINDLKKQLKEKEKING